MDVLSRIVRATLLRIPDAAAEVAEKSAGRVGALCGRPTVIAAKAEAQHRAMSRKRSFRVHTDPDGLYQTEDIIGLGGMSDVMLATCRSNGRRVALKLGDALKHHVDPMQMLQDDSLHYHRLEWAIYKRLNISGTVTGIPQAYDIGVVKMWLPAQPPEEFEEGDDIEQDSSPEATPCRPAAAANEASPILVPQLRPYLSLQLLGPSIDVMVHNKKIPHHKFLQYAELMLTAVENCHKRGIIHRDIKPGNFCLGLGAKAKDVYLVDYGFAKFYDRREAVPQAKEPFGGTPDYSSFRQLDCCTTGPADDLESLGYAWLHMLEGRMPWNMIEALDNPGTPWSSATVLKMRPARERAWKEKAGIPLWLLEWKDECDGHACNELPDYGMMRIILRRCTEDMVPMATIAEE